VADHCGGVFVQSLLASHLGQEALLAGLLVLRDLLGLKLQGDSVFTRRLPSTLLHQQARDRLLS